MPQSHSRERDWEAAFADREGGIDGRHVAGAQPPRSGRGPPLTMEELDLAAVDFRSVLTLDPENSANPVRIRDTDFTALDVLELLAADIGLAEILQEFSELKETDVLACLAYAAHREKVAPGREL